MTTITRSQRYVATAMSARLGLIAFLLCAFVSACAHNQAARDSAKSCDTARVQALEQQGYTWLGQNQWFKAHLAGHALITIGDSCNQADIALPAGIHGAYLLAVAMHAHRDDAQSGYWLERGLKLLALARQHESESQALFSIYDQMQPRFLMLRSQLRTR